MEKYKVTLKFTDDLERDKKARKEFFKVLEQIAKRVYEDKTKPTN